MNVLAEISPLLSQRDSISTPSLLPATRRVFTEGAVDVVGTLGGNKLLHRALQRVLVPAVQIIRQLAGGHLEEGQPAQRRDFLRNA